MIIKHNPFKTYTTFFRSLLVFAWILSAASATWVIASEGPPANLADASNLQSDTLQLQELVEEALVWRVKAVAFAENTLKSRKNGHLTHEELQIFSISAADYLELRGRILELANRSAWMVEQGTDIEFTPGKGTRLEKIETPIPQVEVELLPREIVRVRIDPGDAQGRALLKQMKISLAAALVLYDNYLVGIYPFFENQKTRYLLNHDNPKLEGRLNEITWNYLALEPRRKVARALAWVERDIEWKKKAAMPPDKDEEYLEMLILQSPTRHYLRNNGTYAFKNRVEARIARITDDLHLLKRAFTFVNSKVFGNAVGLVEFRKGRLADLSAQERKSIEAAMEPLDILLEKTPFRLTDKFIPGHYGHVAVWAGNEEQLKALGVWDHPAVAKYQRDIRQGRRIVEALRPGVEINTLEHFLNIDDLLVLRHPTISTEEKREFVIRLFQQVGKEYDFNFDVETDRRIVCSELAYVVYHNIPWPTSKTLGRYTISPDNVAVKAVDGGPLMPVLIYRDGRKVPERLPETLKQLLSN